jgi:hypothetical protein
MVRRRASAHELQKFQRSAPCVNSEHDAWVKQIEKFEAQLGTLAQIRSEQEPTLEKFDRESPVAF